MLTILLTDRGGREADRALRNAAGFVATDRNVDRIYFGSLEEALQDGPLPQSFALIYPEQGLHPEDQALAAAKLGRLVAEGADVVVATHSLVMVYAWNNMLVEGTLTSRLPPPMRGCTVAAFVVTPAPEAQIRRYTLTPCLSEDFIDEAPLGRASDRLGGELNRLRSLATSSPRASGDVPRRPLLCRPPSLLSRLHEAGKTPCFDPTCQTCAAHGLTAQEPHL